MNERIKELAMEHFSVWPDENELESFVKHLLRYCTTICNTVSGDQVDNASKDRALVFDFTELLKVRR